jgi:hypothetical protein
MTKVQAAFKLYRALGDQDLENVSRIPSVYGIFFAKVTPSLDGILVEYDASRLTPKDLEGVLDRFGMPLDKQS